jgi:hypothetical protein
MSKGDQLPARLKRVVNTPREIGRWRLLPAREVMQQRLALVDMAGQRPVQQSPLPEQRTHALPETGVYLARHRASLPSADTSSVAGRLGSNATECSPPKQSRWEEAPTADPPSSGRT